MASFGAGITRESVFAREYEPEFSKMISGCGVSSIAEWLAKLGLPQYENILVGNGYDSIEFIGGDLVESADLKEIGISDDSHRQTIVRAARELPAVAPMCEDGGGGSGGAPCSQTVEEWLRWLCLQEYDDAFRANGFTSMERVHKLWELELVTVLEINMVGHRKRMLASLGERRPPSSASTRYSSEIRSVDLSTTEPEAGAVSQASSHATLEEKEKTKEKKKKASPAKQWRHKPEVLTKGCCNYNVLYLGSRVVRDVKGYESTKEAIVRMKTRHKKESTRNIAKFPMITLSISHKGVKFIDSQSRMVIAEHAIRNINCACQDADDLNYFAYITKDLDKAEQHYCHAFSVKSTDLATEILLTLGQAFEVAYDMALQDKADASAARTLEKKLQGSSPSARKRNHQHQHQGSTGSKSGSSKSSSMEEIIC
ncbi:PREDICTED: ankyrin repeat and sterile alpha motif domain-containing protein 1B-like isoform X3 [Priapulus caudatus]|uniref:Ankyrin repeat and sterile alpha motif domain-containing protein 1B-like isoform X3 n=1 Tax=Priapulus caudatus TaxID=37621 RepID=A0ABM1E8K9_PRICU|nr:PREDICTED: ankyrin repeat and sterile alpha motif domain-containing protein 1B-like isoform X3 [Priapulus caudatus]